MRPVLFRQLPWLEQLVAPEDVSLEGLLEWRAWAEKEYGFDHEVTAEPHVWGAHDPIVDLAKMVDPEKIIIVEI